MVSNDSSGSLRWFGSTEIDYVKYITGYLKQYLRAILGYPILVHLLYDFLAKDPLDLSEVVAFTPAELLEAVFMTECLLPSQSLPLSTTTTTTTTAVSDVGEHSPDESIATSTVTLD